MSSVSSFCEELRDLARVVREVGVHLEEDLVARGSSRPFLKAAITAAPRPPFSPAVEERDASREIAASARTASPVPSGLPSSATHTSIASPWAQDLAHQGRDVLPLVVGRHHDQHASPWRYLVGRSRKLNMRRPRRSYTAVHHHAQVARVRGLGSVGGTPGRARRGAARAGPAAAGSGRRSRDRPKRRPRSNGARAAAPASETVTARGRRRGSPPTAARQHERRPRPRRRGGRRTRRSRSSGRCGRRRPPCRRSRRPATSSEPPTSTSGSGGTLISCGGHDTRETVKSSERNSGAARLAVVGALPLEGPEGEGLHALQEDAAEVGATPGVDEVDVAVARRARPSTRCWSRSGSGSKRASSSTLTPWTAQSGSDSRWMLCGCSKITTSSGTEAPRQVVDEAHGTVPVAVARDARACRGRRRRRGRA